MSSGGGLTILNSTISSNTAAQGGGISRFGSGGSVTVANSIAVGNTATAVGPDCSGAIAIVSANLIGDTGGCIITGTQPLTGDAILGQLASNGGSTQTHALLAGPALDAGDDAVCAATPVSGKDQRGLVRPQGAHCDLGAYESDLPGIPIIIAVSDAEELEGNTGPKTLSFQVSLSRAAPASGVKFDIATANGTAQAGSDYVAKALAHQIIPAGHTNYTFDVVVNGDTSTEGDETFLVNLSNVVDASVGDGQGMGTILNDDIVVPPPVLSISDVAIFEGDVGTTTFGLTVSLDRPAPAGGVTFDIATADGIALAGSDYTAKSLPGQAIPARGTSYAFEVLVNGDVSTEVTETFLVNVANVVGATVGDGQGTGTIHQ